MGSLAGSRVAAFQRARRPVLAVLLLCLALAAGLPLPGRAAAATGDTAPARVENGDGVERFVLKNGLEVVVIPNRRAPIVAHMVWYKVGAADEIAGHSGLAHFLEHLMFKGTRKVPPGEFSRIVARRGGNDNAFTSADYTAYFQNIARENLDLVMELEADRMANLTLDEKIVVTERAVVLEERRERIDNEPASRLGEQMRAALFLNHPYGRPIIGWENEIKRLTRDDALTFYRRHYAPNNAILVVAGDITADELRPIAEKTYGRVPKRIVATRARPAEPEPDAARRVILTSDQVRLPQLTRAYLAPSYRSADPDLLGKSDAHALDVLAMILGGGASSRLYRTLAIERGLAASASGFYDSDGMDYGGFWFSVTPRQGVATETLEAALDAVIDDVVRNGVGADEVARASRQLQADAVYARDDLSVMARVYGAALAVGQTVEDVADWTRRVALVTKDDVDRVAQAVFRPDRAVTGLLLPAAAAPGAAPPPDDTAPQTPLTDGAIR